MIESVTSFSAIAIVVTLLSYFRRGRRMSCNPARPMPLCAEPFRVQAADDLSQGKALSWWNCNCVSAGALNNFTTIESGIKVYGLSTVQNASLLKAIYYIVVGCHRRYKVSKDCWRCWNFGCLEEVLLDSASATDQSGGNLKYQLLGNGRDRAAKRNEHAISIHRDRSRLPKVKICDIVNRSLQKLLVTVQIFAKQHQGAFLCATTP